uniref:receptor-like protein 11 n=1 Tax=Erigeron canadensis TaxID=72917 RepID=UPI001CB9CA4F|nr:receptor-like protein 11 [Erigeron canadensis]
MEATNFIVNVTILFLFFQTYGASSSNTMIKASSNVTCIQRERQTLLLFRKGFTNQSKWLSPWTGLECCGWRGVKCDARTGHVVSLNLSSNGINSTIPVWLSNLTRLVHLDLSRNTFHGGIPDSIGNLSSLSTIDLSMNQLSGPIPPSLDGLSSLTHLSLFGNKLNGSIPESIGLLTSLQSLDLGFNQLSGNIPTSLGQLSNLKELYLDSNKLRGVVSEDHFTKLYNLTTLSLSGNTLITWNVSRHWIPPFPPKSLHASSCCNMGPQFPNWLQTQTHLERLDLSNSSIRDTIPEWFHNISSHLYYLDLSHNEIGPEFPNIQTSTNLEYLLLSNSSIKQSIPEWFHNISSHLLLLDLSNNEIGPQFPNIQTSTDLQNVKSFRDLALT